tara:strand:- start:4796 stop:5572 length:777 start_codon:yes stop_codon:yes gene_type:complete
MSVYLGLSGLIKLKRNFDYSVTETITSAKVDTTADRLTLASANTAFCTGDYVQLTRSGGNLDFLTGAGTQESYYVNVDAVGGLRFFTSWQASINNDAGTAVALLTPGSTYDITMQSLEQAQRLVGDVTSYELSTSRDAIDVASLGEEFQSSVAGLISGSGTISCLWNWGVEGSNEEQANYFHQLILQQKTGSSFTADLYLKPAASNPSGAVDEGKELYYTFDGQISGVSFAFDAQDAVRSQISFVTLGEIKLRFDDPT